MNIYIYNILLMLGLLQQTDKKNDSESPRAAANGFTANKTAHFQQTMGFLTSNFKTSRNRTLKHALPPYLQSFCGSLVFGILLVEIGLNVPFCVRKLTVQVLKSALVCFRLSNLIQCVHFEDCTSLEQLHAFLFLNKKKGRVQRPR